jgi:hypothetical protein
MDSLFHLIYVYNCGSGNTVPNQLSKHLYGLSWQPAPPLCIEQAGVFTCACVRAQLREPTVHGEGWGREGGNGRMCVQRFKRQLFPDGSVSLSHLGRTKNAGQTSCIGFSSLTTQMHILPIPREKLKGILA